MGRLADGDQPYLIESQRLLYIQCGAQVAVVDGIEGAAEYTDHKAGY